MMPSAVPPITPNLLSFLKDLKNDSASHAVEQLTELLKRRQIYNSRPCAIATTHLLLRIVAESKSKSVAELQERIRNVGQRLTVAQPQELAVGNIVRRVLGLIREITEIPSNVDVDVSGPPTPAPTEHEAPPSGDGLSMREVKDDVLNGMREMLDELDQADEQIAGYSLEHIHASQTILTYTSSLTAQKFLLAAAKKRRFTVIQVEGYPNEHESAHDTILHGKKRNDADDSDSSDKTKPLTSAGVTVILIPDSAVYTVMPRVNSVLLPAHAVLRHGGFYAASGARSIATVARAHGVPVVALAAIYKLSAVELADPEELLNYGDASKVLAYDEGELMNEVEVLNPTHDYVPPQLVSLFITNIGAHAPSFIHRIVADHYRDEDVELSSR